MASNLGTAAALLLIMLAAPILEASATDTALPGQVAGTRTRTRAPPPGVRVRCTDVRLVKNGGTCASVARAEGISEAAFRNLNPNITCAAIVPTQRVCVAGTAVA